MLKPSQIRIGLAESETVDLKESWWGAPDRTGKAKNRESWILEMCKDVAALANTAGGTIVLGAEESARGRLSRLVDPQLPDRWTQTTTQLLSDRLDPVPTVALTETPFASTDVGGADDANLGVVFVEWSADPVVVRRKGERGWVSVPIRRDTHSFYAPPRRVITMHDQAARNAYAQLLRLQNAETPAPPSFRLMDRVGQDTGMNWSIESLHATVVVFAANSLRLRIPYSRVCELWEEYGSNVWQVIVDGRLKPEQRHGEGRFWVFSPDGISARLR